jgi:hypothetical protein
MCFLESTLDSLRNCSDYLKLLLENRHNLMSQVEREASSDSNQQKVLIDSKHLMYVYIPTFCSESFISSIEEMRSFLLEERSECSELRNINDAQHEINEMVSHQCQH